MEIGAPEIVRLGDDLRYRVGVRTSGTDRELWFSLSGEYADLVSERSDAALVALLIPAMALGEDIVVAGTISEKLHYTLSGPYQRVVRHIIPSLRPVRIRPAEIRPAPHGASGVATGFSGGIDSFSVLADHHYADAAPGFRLTHLFHFNVGSHGAGGARLFRERYARLKPVAERIGLPFIAVDSNVTEFYTGFNYQSTHTPRTVSAALLLQRGIGRYLCASSYEYASTFVGPACTMGYSEPVTLPLLSPEALDVLCVGSEYTRVEKTLCVAGIGDSHGSLDVCVRGEAAGNCSACWKCMRTLLTLEIAGLLDRYSGVFDLRAYREGRDRYLEEVLRSDDPLLREIVAFAGARGFALSHAT
ncbi:MAG: hypothetical protein WCP22_10920 [Chlamydiota bacterium]